MGILFSSQGRSGELQEFKSLPPPPTSKTNSTQLDRNLGYASEHQPPPSIEGRPIAELSTTQLEAEFETIYQRSSQILKSLNRNPCEELARRVTRSLQENANEMSKCFPAMDEYRQCVNEEVNKKLGVKIVGGGGK